MAAPAACKWEDAEAEHWLVGERGCGKGRLVPVESAVGCSDLGYGFGEIVPRTVEPGVIAYNKAFPWMPLPERTGVWRLVGEFPGRSGRRWTVG